ncbi:MAG TPA: hypothetical protein VMH04_04750 [Candidatus Solibacter sp.]|nr:hypothetical protein [Candidatus Solibacter sp.]
MGETIVEFLKTENATDKLGQCRDLLSDPKLKKRIQKDPIIQVDYDECMSLANVLQTGKGNLGARVLKMQTPGSASFDQGRLVGMELDFWNLRGGQSSYSFDAILKDFVTKFGAPSKSWSDEYQNGFGARFSYRRTSWTNDDAIVMLVELEHDSVTAKITDRAFAERTARDEDAKHKSVLDR